MDLMNHPGSEHEADRAQAGREELVERIARAIRADGTVEPWKGCSSAAHPRPRS